MKINDILRAGHVKRWHTVHTLREQTIAEHMWNVTIIASNIAVKAGMPNSRKQIIEDMSFMHDIKEVNDGDQPSHTKYAALPDTDEKIIVKAADLIEAEWFILNYRGPGTHAKAVQRDVQRRLDDFLIDLPPNILEAVSKVRFEVLSPDHEL